MDFLDELKKEAAAKRSGTARPSGSGTPEPSAGEVGVWTKARELYAFLKELAEELNVVQPEIEASYTIPRIGKLSGLRQERYRVVSDSREELPARFALECVRQGGRGLQSWANSREECEARRKFLQNNYLEFRCTRQPDWRYLFHIEPVVTVSFAFEVLPEQGIIKHTQRNLNGLGVVTYHLNPAKLTREAMNELAKRVVRRPDRFDELVSERVPEDIRKEFQQKIAARRREREQELDHQGEKPSGSPSLLKRLFSFRGK